MNGMQHSRGFTLIEILVAVAITGILMLGVMAVIRDMVRAEKYASAIEEVHVQANSMLDHLARNVRNASSIVSPTPGVSSASFEGTFAPSVVEGGVRYWFDAGVVYGEGVDGVFRLSGEQVEVTDLVFENVTPQGTKGAMRITLAVRTRTPEISYETRLITTVTLR
jgi:prepilin-type N-terminal cleavage/methylation domain-containing protein